MSGASGYPDLITAEEYLEGEPRARVKHEYVDGRVFAMAGASENHNLITMNLAAALHGHLRGGPCKVFSSDMKVRVRQERSTRFYYPDVVVTCDPSDSHPYYKEKPLLVIEVLSDSTWREDRSEKLPAYQSLGAVREIVLIAQNWSEASLYRRDDGWRQILLHRDSDVLALDSVGLGIPVPEIYEGVAFTTEMRPPWYLTEEG